MSESPGRQASRQSFESSARQPDSFELWRQIYGTKGL